MLVNATEMLKKAKAGHYAVGQFNINNLSTADDQNIFALCKLIWKFCKICIQKTFCYLLQEIHCKVNS